MKNDNQNRWFWWELATLSVYLATPAPVNFADFPRCRRNEKITRYPRPVCNNLSCIVNWTMSMKSNQSIKGKKKKQMTGLSSVVAKEASRRLGKIVDSVVLGSVVLKSFQGETDTDDDNNVLEREKTRQTKSPKRRRRRGGRRKQRIRKSGKSNGHKQKKIVQEAVICWLIVDGQRSRKCRRRPKISVRNAWIGLADQVEPTSPESRQTNKNGPFLFCQKDTKPKE